MAKKKPAARSRRRPSKKRRNRIPIPWWLLPWPLLMVNVFVAFAASPNTSIQRVRIEGLANEDLSTFEDQVQSIRALPYWKLSVTEFESSVQEMSDVRSAQFIKNPFRRAKLVIERRHPIAQIDGHGSLAMDETGAVYRERRLIDPSLPTVVLEGAGLKPGFGPLRAYQSARIAKLCQLLDRRLEVEGWIVAVERGSLVCYREGEPGVVELGAPLDLEQKVEQLAQALQSAPDLLTEYSVNLVSPDNAAVREIEN